MSVINRIADQSDQVSKNMIFLDTQTTDLFRNLKSVYQMLQDLIISYFVHGLLPPMMFFYKDDCM